MNIFNRHKEINNIFSNWRDNSVEPFKNIFIVKEKTNIHFQREVKELLEHIESNAIGKRLLEKVQRFSCKIFILSDEIDHTIGLKQGHDVVIGCSRKNISVTNIEGRSIFEPAYLSLFHELVHAYHNVSGKLADSNIVDPLVWTSDEEYKTIVGFPSKKKNRAKVKITENAFRKVEGLPERFGHCDPNLMLNSTKILQIRTQILGKVHERNLSRLPVSFSPPPIASLSEEDLGPESQCALYVNVEYINTNSIKSEVTTISQYFFNEQINEIMGKDCHKTFFGDWHSEEMQKEITVLIPQLKDVQFSVISVVFARLSKLEQEALKDF
ncbi:MAG: M91 family zinc metallopeptidase [Chlamydiota bacterium]|nr:M91 family zinc metallopeptidase [Chlamydiota bacterium]